MANPLCRGFPEELDLAQFEKKCENLKKKKKNIIHPRKKEIKPFWYYFTQQQNMRSEFRVELW